MRRCNPLETLERHIFGNVIAHFSTLSCIFPLRERSGPIRSDFYFSAFSSSRLITRGLLDLACIDPSIIFPSLLHAGHGDLRDAV